MKKRARQKRRKPPAQPRSDWMAPGDWVLARAAERVLVQASWDRAHADVVKIMDTLAVGKLTGDFTINDPELQRRVDAHRPPPWQERI